MVFFLSTSIAALVGDLGAGLADEDQVLRAAYGYRQLQHKQKVKQRQQESGSQESNKDINLVLRSLKNRYLLILSE